MVEIAPNATPPVCKIIDYSKFKYEQKKKQKELKANAHKVVVKEIRFGPNTNEHDLDFKTKHAQKFLEEGNKVKAYVQFAGRTIVFKDRGREILERFAEDLEEYGKPEGYPKMEGKRMIIMFTPKSIPKKKATKEESASTKDDKPKSNKASKETSTDSSENKTVKKIVGEKDSDETKKPQKETKNEIKTETETNTGTKKEGKNQQFKSSLKDSNQSSDKGSDNSDKGSRSDSSKMKKEPIVKKASKPISTVKKTPSRKSNKEEE